MRAAFGAPRVRRPSSQRGAPWAAIRLHASRGSRRNESRLRMTVSPCGASRPATLALRPLVRERVRRHSCKGSAPCAGVSLCKSALQSRTGIRQNTGRGAGEGTSGRRRNTVCPCDAGGVPQAGRRPLPWPGCSDPPRQGTAVDGSAAPAGDRGTLTPPPAGAAGGLAPGRHLSLWFAIGASDA